MDERVCRFNNGNEGQLRGADGRCVKRTDAGQLDVIAGMTAEKRLTYANLTGRRMPEAAF